MTERPAICGRRVLGSSPEQIAETDRVYFRYVADLYEDAARLLDELDERITRLERDFVGWPR